MQVTTKSTISLTGTATMLANQKAVSAVMPPTLERPVCLVAEKVRVATDSFTAMHKALRLRTKKTKAVEEIASSKSLFRTECEDIRQVLLAVNRHAVDFTASCQREPDDRAISAHRCQKSGKAILGQMQELVRTYEEALEDILSRRKVLDRAWTPDIEIIARKDAQFSGTEAAKCTPENLVAILYQTLDDIRVVLRDLFAFWDNHVTFLNLILNRQSNFPIPGKETSFAVAIWTKHQKTLLQSSSSLAECTDALSAQFLPLPTASGFRLPWRRDTYPQPSVKRQLTRTMTISKPSPSSSQSFEKPAKQEKPRNVWLAELFRRLI